jgi:hypothetical protein
MRKRSFAMASAGQGVPARVRAPHRRRDDWGDCMGLNSG